MELLHCAFCGSNRLENYQCIGHAIVFCTECEYRAPTKIWNTRHSPSANWDTFATNELIKCQKAYNELLEKHNSPWVSIKDRLPKIKENVLVIDGDQLTVGYLDSVVEEKTRYSGPIGETSWYLSYESWSTSEISLCNVTHWMLLPSPPKE